MRNESTAQMLSRPLSLPWSNLAPDVSRKAAIGLILVIALFAFELFNFATTRFALDNLLGDVRFAGLRWAGILAVAFCSIDFAGLTRLFTPERSLGESHGSWYLMGAWLLGATMNALMTWWAVSLTLLNHEFGNEVLSREQLLQFVPIFVAAMVWLTRILFIGAFTVAGNQIWKNAEDQMSNYPQPRRAPRQSARPSPKRSATATRVSRSSTGRRSVADVPDFVASNSSGDRRARPGRASQPGSQPVRNTKPRRTMHRPPVPGSGIKRIPLEVEPIRTNGNHK